MNSVNTSQQEGSAVKVSNLYKKLGISNNQAVKPPLPKEQSQSSIKAARRQTVFVPHIPENFKNLQRCSTYRSGGQRSYSNLHRQEEEAQLTVKPTRDSTPKSRFISNWIQKKEKENESIL